MKGQKGSAGRKGTPGAEVRAGILVAQFVITLLPLSPSFLFVFLTFFLFSPLYHFLLSSPLFSPFSLFFFPSPTSPSSSDKGAPGFEGPPGPPGPPGRAGSPGKVVS